MNDTPLFIPLLLGTNREGRQSEAVAQFLLEKLGYRTDVATELFDVRAFTFSANDYGGALKEKNAPWRDAVRRADGLLIVSPEYNHGYPGTLKAALDLLFDEYKHKAVGIAAVSGGPWGGARMVENLLPVLRELGLVAIHQTLYFPNAGTTFGPRGTPADAGLEKRVGAFLDELVWMARVLKAGRASL
ncbi:MAG: NADPH-dependent FMN reductase [bacterium]|nr:NADPH-dependent FMN reductase [bacterium]